MFNQNSFHVGKYLDVELNVFTDDDCVTVKGSEHRITQVCQEGLFTHWSTYS